MVPLNSGLRGALEKAVVAARDEAEKAAEVALKTLAIDKPEAFASHTEEQRRLRKALRAKARQLGGGSLEGGFRSLVEEVAYEQWHRMLFARFLMENDLLMHPTGVPVTLEDCAELAAGEGEPDPWQLAARYASRMLPGIFRTDDPGVHLPLPVEGRAALEAILSELPAAIFTSDDGLGWVYQFWQSKKKKEVSQSGRKIERLDLAAYSQLFTEHYMVQFLLENSLGAWWAARHPDSPLVGEFTYLRLRDDGIPAAGTFPGWPELAAELTVMDPCCGSGHFLVAAFEMLRRMRMEEEGLGEAEAADAVLRDNLFGLEIDPRCVQIGAFAVALAAWKAGGYRALPLPNIDCSGIPVSGQLEEWTKLAGDDVNAKYTLEGLYHLFRNAPDLGSLINPANVPIRDRMFAPDFAKVGPLLERALAKERAANDPVAAVFGEAARGVACAADLLAREYTLIATNVPYLARGKQGETLKAFIESHHPEAKADLATAFLERCRAFTSEGGTYALVTPQNWLFLSSYKKLRETLLKQQAWHVVARLGPGAFETISGEVVNVVLVILTDNWPPQGQVLSGVDGSGARTAREKAQTLRSAPNYFADQATQLRNPDSRVIVGDLGVSGRPLSEYASTYEGMHSGDYPRFGRQFWELAGISGGWSLQQEAPATRVPWGGRESVILWEDGKGQLVRFVQKRLQSEITTRWIKGRDAWGRRGVVVAAMQDLRATLYDGKIFTHGAYVVIPKDEAWLPALWAFVQSDEFRNAARRLDQKLAIARAVFDGIPFDLERWKKVAEELYPDELPEPHSDDSTQWLFKGNAAGSEAPLQVAVARLLGYHWPQQDPDRLSTLADEDGILPLSPAAREEPAAERLRAVLATAYGESWSPGLQEQLLNEVGFAGKGLDVWLRDGFFEQHCKLFQQRPFIWHIWDGRRDGFSALVNYHKLDSARLDKLIYTYLGEWIRIQRAARDAGTPGADGPLVAALELHKKLEAIRDGEPPHDIYVRWKPIEKQPIGWDPDLNDGVRLNIRPFVTAGVLRSRVNVHWNKDRGLNPDGSERINDCHVTRVEKLSARKAAGT